jgi:ClpP class serine protease
VKAIASGAVWIAAEARSRGLVDGVATFEDAVAGIRAAGGPVVARAAAPPPPAAPRARPAPAQVAAPQTAYEVATARAQAMVRAGEAASFTRALAEVWRRDQEMGGDLWRRYDAERGGA